MVCLHIARRHEKFNHRKNNTANIGFEKEIWKAADLLRRNLDVSEYKSVQVCISKKHSHPGFPENPDAILDIFFQTFLVQPRLAAMEITHIEKAHYWSILTSAVPLYH